MFPARAGMSPLSQYPHRVQSGVPRASGDEPIMMRLRTFTPQCSPRERG